MKRQGLKGLIGGANCSTSNQTNPRNFLFHSKGFTLIELIVVIILAGILVATVVVKVSMTPSEMSNISAVDQVVADIQYTQMRAMAARTPCSIAFNSGSSSYTISGATSETKTLPGGMTAGSTATFEFNSLGELLLKTGCINASPLPSYCRLSLGGTTITGYCITGKVSVP